MSWRAPRHPHPLPDVNLTVESSSGIQGGSAGGGAKTDATVYDNDSEPFFRHLPAGVLRVWIFCLFFLFMAAPTAYEFSSQGLNLSCSRGTTGSFNPPCGAGDGTRSSAGTRAAAVGVLTHCTTVGTPIGVVWYSLGELEPGTHRDAAKVNMSPSKNSHLEVAPSRSENKLKIRKVFEHVLVMLLSPGAQDAEGEEGERRALDGPAGQGVAAPLHDLPEVVGRGDILKQAPCKRADQAHCPSTEPGEAALRVTGGYQLREHKNQLWENKASPASSSVKPSQHGPLPFHVWQ